MATYGKPSIAAPTNNTLLKKYLMLFKIL